MRIQLQGRAGDLCCGGEIAEHQFRADADDAETEAAELQLPDAHQALARARDMAPSTSTTNPMLGAKKSDEEPCERHLAASETPSWRALSADHRRASDFGEPRAVLAGEELEASLRFELG